jgi:hypothetical protein
MLMHKDAGIDRRQNEDLNEKKIEELKQKIAELEAKIRGSKYSKRWLSVLPYRFQKIQSFQVQFRKFLILEQASKSVFGDRRSGIL